MSHWLYWDLPMRTDWPEWRVSLLPFPWHRCQSPYTPCRLRGKSAATGSGALCPGRDYSPHRWHLRRGRQRLRTPSAMPKHCNHVSDWTATHPSLLLPSATPTDPQPESELNSVGGTELLLASGRTLMTSLLPLSSLHRKPSPHQSKCPWVFLGIKGEQSLKRHFIAAFDNTQGKHFFFQHIFIDYLPISHSAPQHSRFPVLLGPPHPTKENKHHVQFVLPISPNSAVFYFYLGGEGVMKSVKKKGGPRPVWRPALDASVTLAWRLRLFTMV